MGWGGRLSVFLKFVFDGIKGRFEDLFVRIGPDGAPMAQRAKRKENQDPALQDPLKEKGI